MDNLPEGTFARQRKLTVAAVFIIGFVVALSDSLGDDQFPYSTWQLAAWISLGAVLFYLSLQGEALLDRDPSARKTAAYFAVQLALLTAVQLLSESPNGIWLLAMPLAGTAQGRLSLPWRLLVFGGIEASIGIPVGLLYDWSTAATFSFSVLPAVIFVALFVQLVTVADEARSQAVTLAADLKTANRQLAVYATQAEEMAAAEERNRLAREIHDSLGHYLTVINVQLEAARVTMADEPERALDAVNKAQALTREGLASVRQSIGALRESPLGSRSLTAAVEALIQETQQAGLVAELRFEGSPRPLEPNIELTLFRAAQEGLTNVRKHARASRVDLTLDYSAASEVRLIVQDNGVGGAALQEKGFGLLGIRERAHLLDGRLKLETSPGKGFRLMITLPTDAYEPHPSLEPSG